MKTEQIGISKLKSLTYKDLRELNETVLEIEEYKGRAIAVVMPMRMFLKMQYLIIRADELLRLEGENVNGNGDTKTN